MRGNQRHPYILSGRVGEGTRGGKCFGERKNLFRGSAACTWKAVGERKKRPSSSVKKEGKGKREIEPRSKSPSRDKESSLEERKGKRRESEGGMHRDEARKCRWGGGKKRGGRPS